MGRIAITGGSGFIGSAIYSEMNRYRRSKGEEPDIVFLFDRTEPNYRFDLPSNVHWIKCNVSDKESVNAAMEAAGPLDQLWLVAGVLGTSELNETPSIASDVNVTGLANFMDLVVKAKKNNQKFPRVFYPSKPNVWPNMYTITKEASEKIIQYYMKEYGLKGVIHKWFNAYGPRQHTHPVRKAVPYFTLMALNNKPLKIHGDGTQTTDLIHVADIAKIAVASMNKPEHELTNQEVIDIGVGTPVNVNDLAEFILKLCNSKSEIIHKPMRSGEIPKTKLVADTTRLKQIMGPDFKFTDFEIGMRETIEYYRNLNPIQAQAALEFYNKNS